MAVVRLQCPACAAIVKISEQMAAQHSVVRCGQCQGLVQVAENRLPAKVPTATTEEKPRYQPARRKVNRNQAPIGMIVGAVLGVLVLCGVGFGLYFLIDNGTSAKAEQLMVKTLTMLGRMTTIVEGINKPEEVPAAMTSLLEIQKESQTLQQDALELDKKLNRQESARLQEKYKGQLQAAAERALAALTKLMVKPRLVAAIRKYTQENGNAFTTVGPGINLGNILGTMPGSGGAGPQGPGFSATARLNQSMLESALTSKKNMLQTYSSMLDSVSDGETFEMAIRNLESFANNLARSHNEIVRFESRNVFPSSEEALNLVSDIERLEGKLSGQVSRLERLKDVSHQVDQLKKLFRELKINITPTGPGTASNDRPPPPVNNPGPPPANPFEQASGGNAPGRTGNTPPPANPFEPATGNNPGNAGSNPFEPAPSKSGGSMPARASASLDDTLSKMTGTDWVKKRDALNELQTIKIDEERRKEVLDALFNLFDDKDIHNKTDVLKVYKKWASTQEQKERLGTIAESLLADHWTKKDILRFYADNKVSSASNEVARKLKDVFDRKEAEECLIAIGSEAESAVIPYLGDLDNQVRHVAIKVLARIGTKNSLPELQRLQNDRFVGLAARQAIKIINSRK